MSMPFNEITWLMMTYVIKKPLENKYGKTHARKYIKDAKPICKQMFQDVDDIGKDNPMKGNLYGAFPLMAIWKAADGEITPEDYAEVIHEMMAMPIVKKKMLNGNYHNIEERKRIKQKFIRNQKWAEDHPQYEPYTWDFHFDDNKPNNEIAYHFTRCPLHKFAKEHGFLEILPVMCDMDYITANFMNATLIREHTLAKDGDYCDYWFVDKEM